VAIKLPLRALQITASRPSNYRFVIRIPKPSSRACRGSSESRHEGTKNSAHTQAFFEFIFDLFQLLKSVSVTRYNVS
jgi:hypothetical protein